MIRLYFLLICILSLTGNILAQNVNVTFIVDASDINVSVDGISIGGNFQNWDPPSGGMTAIGNGQYQRVYSVAANSQIQFKFINGNSWGGTIESVPTECGISDGFGGYNRIFNVGASDVTYGPVCFSSCEACVEEELIPVTFQVDMSNESVSDQGVHIAGSFQDWNPDSDQLMEIGDGIYEITLDVPVNSTHYFKFINGNTWDEQESVPSLCGISDGFGAYNRFFQTDTEAGSYGPVCFESCYECGESIPVIITFSVDMSEQEVNPDGVFMTGSFNDFSPTDLQMFNAGNGVYQVSLVLNQGENISYKFLNGPDFIYEEIVPEDCGVSNGLGGFNRTYTCGNTPETLSPVCFSQCAACAEEAEYSVTLQVNMQEQTVSLDGVFVAGNFNDYNASANQMTDLGNGIFSTDITTAANEVLIYKFLNGPDYEFEETVPSDCGIDNGFGGYDRAIFIDSDLTLAPVCFSTCENCLPENIKEKTDSKLNFFPNPSNGIFYLNDTQKNQPHYFQIFDNQARLISYIFVENGVLNLSGFDSGLYHIVNENNDIFRVIIE